MKAFQRCYATHLKRTIKTPIGFEEYRNQRKIILNKIDEEFNGHNLTDVQKDHTEDSSILMKTIACFTNTDVDI